MAAITDTVSASSACLRRLVLLGLVALALWGPVCPAQAARGPRILVPRNQAVLDNDSLVILGQAPRGSSVAWSLERPSGRESDTVRADWGDLFEIFAILDPGLNRFEIGGTRLEVFYNPGDLDPPSGFAPQRIHAGDVSRCEDCHASLDMALLDGGYPGVCLNCHVVVSSNPANPQDARDDSHFNTAIAQCSGCHEPHVAADPQLLRQDRVAACARCHPAQGKGAAAHPAFAEGGCNACHAPHFSGYPKVLDGATAEVCGGCHDQGAAVGDAQTHPPTVTGRACAACHDPHGAQRGLLPATPATLCGTCHTQVLERGHGAELAECGTCHDPHGALGSGLMAGDPGPACAQCHPEIGRGKTVHPALDEGCQSCHDPHSDTSVAEARRSCATCHDLEADAELASVHGNLRIPAGRCGSCHPAHAAANERLVIGRLHAPLTRGQCSVCHGGGDERSVEIDDVAARCRMCHAFEKQMRERGESLHDPVAEGECVACHDPHMSTRGALLRGPEATLCGECHDTAIAAQDQQTHPPAEQCTPCHAPHGGGRPKFLKALPPQLCLDCHDDPRRGREPLHPALDEGCLVCHDPHVGHAPGYLKGPQPYTACLDCHEVPDLADGKTLHTAARNCAGCHDPHGGSGERYLQASPPSLCQRCHAAAGSEGKHQHAALDEGCEACHDPHSGWGGASLRRAPRDLCLDCHDDPAAGRERPHAPALAWCNGCHEPHAADRASLLKGTGPQLCRLCHPVDVEFGLRKQHPPTEDCENCHEHAPHGGSTAHFLSSPPPELCLDCHDDPRTGVGTPHAALDEGCLTCHDPHAGVGPGYLRGNSPGEACLACHDDPTGGRPQVHGALLRPGCSGCHEPHRSPHPGLLRREGNALCTGCHDVTTHPHSLDVEKGARFAGSAEFPSDGDRYACTGCHDPHASGEPKLFVRPREQLCVACHAF